MADMDQAVVNLERFIGLLANATSAVGQVEDHVVENGKQFAELEQDAGEEGGGLNDRLEELATTLETEEGEVVTALGELTQAGTTAQQDVTEVDTKVEQAATDLDQTANAVESALEQASTQLGNEGFEPVEQALEAAQGELETSSQELEQSLDGTGERRGRLREGGRGGLERERRRSWRSPPTGAGRGRDRDRDGGAGGRAGIRRGRRRVRRTRAERSSRQVDQIYDDLDSGCGHPGSGVGAGGGRRGPGGVRVRGASAREQRLEPSASMVEDEALGTLSQEYEALGTVLDAAAAARSRSWSPCPPSWFARCPWSARSTS